MIKLMLSTLMLFACTTAIAQTPFPARFVEPGETVVVTKGDYVQTRDCIVRKGGTLILEAGTNVKVSGLGVPIQVYGTLEIRGTSTNPVVIGPDVNGVCGTITAYYVDGPRPRVLINNLQLTTTKNSNSIFLSFAEFSISNSSIENRSALSSNRVCVLAGNNSTGILSNCYLKCLNDGASTVGVSIGNGSVNRQADTVQLENIITEDCKDPIRIQKRVALLNATIE